MTNPTITWLRFAVHTETLEKCSNLSCGYDFLVRPNKDNEEEVVRSKTIDRPSLSIGTYQDQVDKRLYSPVSIAYLPAGDYQGWHVVYHSVADNHCKAMPFQKFVDRFTPLSRKIANDIGG